MTELGEKLRRASAGRADDEPEQEVVDEPCCTVCGEELEGEKFPFCLADELNEGVHCTACPCLGVAAS